MSLRERSRAATAHAPPTIHRRQAVLTALFDHLAWADAQALEALRAMPSGTPEAERARTIYAHLAAAAHVWLAQVDGRLPAHPVWPTLDVEEAATLLGGTAAALRALAAGLDAHGLAREVAYRTSVGQPLVSTVGDILTHVALHGSYHRGQLALLARQGGGTPAGTDLIAFVRGTAVPPRAELPNAAGASTAVERAG
jgi:uncharacterized damage-inducible protein DinB